MSHVLSVLEYCLRDVSNEVLCNIKTSVHARIFLVYFDCKQRHLLDFVMCAKLYLIILIIALNTHTNTRAHTMENASKIQ